VMFLLFSPSKTEYFCFYFDLSSRRLHLLCCFAYFRYSFSLEILSLLEILVYENESPSRPQNFRPRRQREVKGALGARMLNEKLTSPQLTLFINETAKSHG